MNKSLKNFGIFLIISLIVIGSLLAFTILPSMYSQYQNKLTAPQQLIPNTYQNTKYGFELVFPATWKSTRGDFGYNEEMYPDFGYVSFQPDNSRFEIFQIGIFTKEQWNNWSSKTDVHILGQSDAYVFTSSEYQKNISDDCSGGEQFNNFERDRCKETPKILSTFRVINK